MEYSVRFHRRRGSLQESRMMTYPIEAIEQGWMYARSGLQQLPEPPSSDRFSDPSQFGKTGPEVMLDKSRLAFVWSSLPHFGRADSSPSWTLGSKVDDIVVKLGAVVCGTSRT